MNAGADRSAFVDAIMASVVCTVVDDTVVAIVGECRRWLLLYDVIAVIVVSDVKAKSSRVDVAVAKEEHRTEDGLSKNVENTIEYRF